MDDRNKQLMLDLDKDFILNYVLKIMASHFDEWFTDYDKEAIHINFKDKTYAVFEQDAIIFSNLKNMLEMRK